VGTGCGHSAAAPAAPAAAPSEEWKQLLTAKTDGWNIRPGHTAKMVSRIMGMDCLLDRREDRELRDPSRLQMRDHNSNSGVLFVHPIDSSGRRNAMARRRRFEL